MNEVVIKDNQIFIDGVEIQGVLKRIIKQTPGRDTVTITFNANVELKSN
jgi:hypothetical protein